MDVSTLCGDGNHHHTDTVIGTVIDCVEIWIGESCRTHEVYLQNHISLNVNLGLMVSVFLNFANKIDFLWG